MDFIDNINLKLDFPKVYYFYKTKMYISAVFTYSGVLAPFITIDYCVISTLNRIICIAQSKRYKKICVF